MARPSDPAHLHRNRYLFLHIVHTYIQAPDVTTCLSRVHFHTKTDQDPEGTDPPEKPKKIICSSWSDLGVPVTRVAPKSSAQRPARQEIVSEATTERAPDEPYSPLVDHQTDGHALLVTRHVIRPLLLQVIQALGTRPPNIDLLQGGVISDNMQRTLQHALIAILVSFGQRKGLEMGEKVELD